MVRGVRERDRDGYDLGVERERYIERDKDGYCLGRER